jgi:hypothetical protein
MTDKVGGSPILRVCQSDLNTNLGLARNEVLTTGFSSTTTGGTFQARCGGVIFSPYIWNLGGKLGNLNFKAPNQKLSVPQFA